MSSEINTGEMVSMIRDKYCGGSNIKFAEIMGESTTTVSNWCNAKSIGKQVMIKILSKFESVDANWFLMGRGEMEIPPSEITSEDNVNIKTDMDEMTRVAMQAMAEKIQRLEHEVTRLRNKYEPQEERSAV